MTSDCCKYVSFGCAYDEKCFKLFLSKRFLCEFYKYFLDNENLSYSKNRENFLLKKESE